MQDGRTPDGEQHGDCVVAPQAAGARTSGPGLLDKGRVTGAGLRRWLFADQLGPHFLDSEDQPMLLVEARSVFRRRSFHRQKAHLVLSALRHRAAELGERARFHQGETYREALNALGERVSVCAPTSRAADRFVRGLDDVEVLPARGFTMSRKDFSDWTEGRRRLLLEDFYREQRPRTAFSWKAARRPPGGGTRRRQPGTPASRSDPARRRTSLAARRGRDRRTGASRPRLVGGGGSHPHRWS
jgi:hypothetical protein